MEQSQVALITGAGRGIRRAISLRLAPDGFDVGLLDVREDLTRGVQKEVEAISRRAHVITAAVSDRRG